METKIYCPHCGKVTKLMTEDDDGRVYSRLVWCWNCEHICNIQTGPQIEEWFEEAQNQL